MNKNYMISDFVDFKNEVVMNILGYLSDEYKDASVELKEVVKNNDTKVCGLIVKKAESNIAPNIYLEGFYKDFEDGKSMEKILEEIAEVREKYEIGHMDVSYLSDYSLCRDKILPRLVNADMNRELLEERPHRVIVDLAVIYVVDLSDNMSVPVTDKIISTWGVDEEDLYNDSLKNLPLILPSTFQTIGDVLRKMMPASEFGDMDLFPATDGFYVLSNERNCYGAASLLDSAKMAEISSLIGEGYYIAPSSVHEVLLIPDAHMEPAALASMVHDVNLSTVSESDRLSDSIYRYDAEKGLMKVDIHASVA